MPHNLMTALVIAPLIVFVLYRRVRRNFGRQPIRPTRSVVRMVLFGALTVLMGLGALRDLHLAEGLLAGLLGGAVLGLVGLRRTRFEISGQRDFYVPDPWIGLALTTLLLGRLIYRFMAIYPALHSIAAHAASSTVIVNLQRSPLTQALFGMLFGYCICYYAGILIHHRRALTRLRAAAAA